MPHPAHTVQPQASCLGGKVALAIKVPRLENLCLLLTFTERGQKSHQGTFFFVFFWKVSKDANKCLMSSKMVFEVSEREVAEISEIPHKMFACIFRHLNTFKNTSLKCLTPSLASYIPWVFFKLHPKLLRFPLKSILLF